MKKNFLDLEQQDIIDLAQDLGLAKFRAKQLVEWQNKGISSFDEMTNLSKDIREKLSQDYYPGLPEVRERFQSADSLSQKFVLAYPDGHIIEAVLMKQKYGYSLCMSTQVGCYMGCKFCASTGLKKERNLTRGELLGQFFCIEKLISPELITNIDLMGIGEPLDNYKEVVAFIKRITDSNYRNFSARKVSLSTCGLVPEIRKLANEGLPLTLAVSLHAPTQALREEIMPIARTYPLTDLLEATHYYFDKTGRRVTYEYTLFKDFNDSKYEARALAELLHGVNCHVNLIPANKVEGSPFLPSSPEIVNAFLNELNRKGINATLRKSFGQDIDAACGQLRRDSLLEDE